MEHRIQYPFKNDHDFLIALIEDFNNSIAIVTKQIQEDHTTTLEVKEIIEKQYSHLSERIDKVEKDLALLDPVQIAQLVTDARESKQWISDFNRSKHVAWVIASTGFVVIGYYIPAIIANVLRIFGGQR